MIRKLAGIASVIMALGAVDASADTLQLTGWNPYDGTVGQVNVTGFGTESAGRLGGLLNGVSFTTYCSQLNQSIGFGSSYTDYSVVATDGAGGFTATQATALGKLFTFAATSVVDHVTSAAFQLAVWEIVYETTGSYSASGGTFMGTDITAGVVAQANIYLAGISTITTSTYNIQRLVSPTRQDMVYATLIPEPATMALMGAGLLLLGYRQRRSLPEQNA